MHKKDLHTASETVLVVKVPQTWNTKQTGNTKGVKRSLESQHFSSKKWVQNVVQRKYLPISPLEVVTKGNGQRDIPKVEPIDMTNNEL